MMNKNGSLILLYDGICGFCIVIIGLIIKHDKKGTIRFVSLQSQFASKIFERAPHLKDIDSLILIESFSSSAEKIFVRSSGTLVIARYLGGWWTLLLIGYIIPSPVRDWFYDIFTKYRYRLFGRYDSCPIPPPEIRSRFIEIP